MAMPMVPTDLPAQYMPMTNLGAPVRVFKQPAWKLALRGLLILGLVGGGATFLAFQMMGNKQLEGTGWYFGPILLAAGLWHAWATYRRVQTSAVAFEHGFAYSTGGDVRGVRWDEIASVQSRIEIHRSHGIPVHTTHQHTIMLNSGEKFVLGGYIHQIGDLAAIIRQSVFPLLFPRHAEAYNRGDTLEFGPIKISKTAGLEAKGKAIPWAELKGVNTNQGSVWIHPTTGGWFRAISLPASAVPNLDVLMGILQQVKGDG